MPNSGDSSTQGPITSLISTITGRISSDHVDDALELADRVLELIEENTASPEERAGDILSDVLHKMNSDDPARIALVGQTSSGKSSTVNSLFGKDIAEIRAGTDTTDSVLRLEFGGGLVLYDTPGLVGEGELENITRGFLRIDQVPDLQQIETIPYRANPNASTKEISLERLDEVAPIDSVLFIINSTRPRSRPERRILKNIFLLLSEQYGDQLVVGGTHLDVLKDKNKEDREELLNSVESVTREKVVLFSNNSGEGLGKLTQEVFESLPSGRDASALQSALVEERKLNRLQFVLTDVSKMVSNIYMMKGSEEDDIKVSIVAMNCIIKKHYSISEEKWKKINGKIDKIKRQVKNKGFRNKNVPREPEAFLQMLQSLLGATFTDSVREDKKVGIEGVKLFLPDTVALIGEHENGYDSESIKKNFEALLEDNKSELKVAGDVSKGMLSKVISNILFDLFEISK